MNRKNGWNVKEPSRSTSIQCLYELSDSELMFRVAKRIDWNTFERILGDSS